MKALCFDTETTGLWKNPKALITDDKNWPYIIQLAWILSDMETGRVISSNEGQINNGMIVLLSIAYRHNSMAYTISLALYFCSKAYLGSDFWFCC